MAGLALSEGRSSHHYTAAELYTEPEGTKNDHPARVVIGEGGSEQAAADAMGQKDVCMQETAERSFADAKQHHGHRYARFRGLSKVQMQCLLVATAQNMKKMALLYWLLRALKTRSEGCQCRKAWWKRKMAVTGKNIAIATIGH